MSGIHGGQDYSNYGAYGSEVQKFQSSLDKTAQNKNKDELILDLHKQHTDLSKQYNDQYKNHNRVQQEYNTTKDPTRKWILKEYLTESSQFLHATFAEIGILDAYLNKLQSPYLSIIPVRNQLNRTNADYKSSIRSTPTDFAKNTVAQVRNSPYQSFIPVRADQIRNRANALQQNPNFAGNAAARVRNSQVIAAPKPSKEHNEIQRLNQHNAQVNKFLSTKDYKEMSNEGKTNYLLGMKSIISNEKREGEAAHNIYVNLNNKLTQLLKELNVSTTTISSSNKAPKDWTTTDINELEKSIKANFKSKIPLKDKLTNIRNERNAIRALKASVTDPKAKEELNKLETYLFNILKKYEK